MNELYEKEYLAFKDALGSESVIFIEKGPLFRENYLTYKLKIQAPDSSRIDISGYNVILVFPLKSYKPSKVKVATSGKGLPAFFLEALTKHITSMICEFGIEVTVSKLIKDYDAVLLKLWSFFERYQHYEGTLTIIRYQLRSEPPQMQLPAEAESVSTKSITVSTPIIENKPKEPLPEKTSESSPDPPIPEESKSAKPNSMDVSTNADSELKLTTSTGTLFSWSLSKPKELVFRSLSDFRTIGEYYADLYTRSETSIPESFKPAVKAGAIYFVNSSNVIKDPETCTNMIASSTISVRSAPIGHNTPWTEVNSDTYSEIFDLLLGGEPLVKPIDTKMTIPIGDGKHINEVRGIYGPLALNGQVVNPRCLLTVQLLKLGRFFFEYGFEIIKVTTDTVLLRFNFPFSLLDDDAIEKLKPNFPSLYKGIAELPNLHLPFIVSIILKEKGCTSMINPDPMHSLLQTVQEIAKRDISIEYFPDKYDYDALHYLTKCINIVLRQAPLAVKDSLLLSTCPSDDLVAYEEKICKQLKDKIALLPNSLRHIPVDDRFNTFIDLYTFFTVFLPQILPTLFNTSADKASEIKIARALGKVKANGYQLYEDSDKSSDTTDTSLDEYYSETDNENDILAPDNYTFNNVSALVCDGFLLDTNDFTNSDGQSNRLADLESSEVTQPRRKLNGLRLYIQNISLSGIVLLQFKSPSITVACSKCLRITVLTLTTREKQSIMLFDSSNCSGCGCTLSVLVYPLIFNNFSGGPHGAEALLVESHTSCFPIGLAHISTCRIICQCASCDNTSEHSRWKQLQAGTGSSYIQSFCPICFGKMTLRYGNATFALPNGSTIELPKRASIQQKRQQLQSGPLPNNGTCKHATNSYRWFRFACGLAYPCDTCHSKACACGNSVAEIQLCGFCGKEANVQPVCPHCRKDLVSKRTTHWEGGTGCRDKSMMSRKDTKKYAGSKIKTRSKKAEKREEMRHRGNAKKKPGDRW